MQQKTKGVRRAKKTQEDSKRKSVASTMAHQSDLSNFRLPFDEVGDTVLRLRLGHAWVVSSRNCFVEVCFPHVISFSSIYHEVLDHRPSGCSGPFISAFCLCLQPCDMRCAERGAAAAFKYFFFDFVLCDVGYLVLTQSHSVDIYCWSALVIPSLSRIVFRSFLCSHCVVFFKWNPFSTVFCCFDP